VNRRVRRLRSRWAARCREAGQTTTEYALILAPLALLLIVAIVFLRMNVSATLVKGGERAAFKPPVAACDGNYSGGCVPPFPPAVDCADLAALGITHVTVTGDDPHHLDPDGDGVACD
jgi:Flp pilus assembly pilin Flp